MNEIKEKITNIKKEQIIIFCVGLLIGLLTMIIFYPDRIAQLKNGEEVAITIGKENITADDMYFDLKEKYSVNSILELVDKKILDKKYEMTEGDLKSIDESVQTYLNYYTQSGLTEEEFLSQAGFENLDDFKAYIELDYKRNKYYQEYMEANISDDEVNAYYNNNVFGTINTEHMLVESSKTDAESVANEILEKLKNGASWEDVKNEYKSSARIETVPIDFDSNLESNYVEASKKISDGTYTTELVKTSYGYHIIFRVSTDEKKEQKDLTSRIKKAIITEKQNNDQKLYEKTMIEMREKEEMDIKDTELKSAYEEYKKQYE